MRYLTICISVFFVIATSQPNNLFKFSEPAQSFRAEQNGLGTLFFQNKKETNYKFQQRLLISDSDRENQLHESNNSEDHGRSSDSTDSSDDRTEDSSDYDDSRNSDGPDAEYACKRKGFFYYLNGSCLAQCNLETYRIFSSAKGKFCLEKEKLLKNGGIQSPYIETLQNYSSVGSKIVTISLACGQLIGTSSSSTTSKILLLNVIQFIKYLDINYPQKLLSVFQNQVTDFVSFDFMPGLPAWIQPDLTEYKSPDRFARYNINGLFILNFGGEAFTTLVIGLTSLLLLNLRKRKSKFEIINKICAYGREFLVWNFLITFLLTNLGEAILFAIIEMRQANLEGVLPFTSLCFDMIFLLTYLLLIGFMLLKLYEISTNHTLVETEEKLKRYSSVKVLFEDGKNRYLVQQLLVFITSFRVIIASVVIGVLDAPTTQAIMLLILNVSMIAYFVIFRPNKVGWKNFELLLYEILALIANTICLKMSLMDSSDQFTDYQAENAIIIIDFVLISFVIFFQLIEWILFIIKTTQAYKKKNQIAKICPQTHIIPISEIDTEDSPVIKDITPSRNFLIVQTPKSALKRAVSDPSNFESNETLETISDRTRNPEPHSCLPISKVIAIKHEKLSKFQRQINLNLIYETSDGRKLVI